jgi:hypothetical protein
MRVAGKPTTYSWSGDEAVCQQWLPFAQKQLAKILKRGYGYGLQTYPIDDVTINVRGLHSIGKIIIDSTSGGIVCRPVSIEHPAGWGAPFTVNLPLGTALSSDSKNRDLLRPTKPSELNSLLKVSGRGVSTAVGNLSSFTKRASGKYYVLSFTGASSNWAVNTNRWPELNSLLNVVEGGPIFNFPSSGNSVFVSGVTHTLPDGLKVLAARFVDRVIPGGTVRTLYVAGYQFGGDFGDTSMDQISVLRTSDFVNWTYLYTITDPVNDSWVVGDKFDPGAGYNPTFPVGRLCYYSRFEFSPDGDKLSCVLAAYRVVDSSAFALGLVYGVDIQKYVATVSGLTASAGYEITRFDAAQPGSGVFGTSPYWDFTFLGLSPEYAYYADDGSLQLVSARINARWNTAPGGGQGVTRYLEFPGGLQIPYGYRPYVSREDPVLYNPVYPVFIDAPARVALLVTGHNVAGGNAEYLLYSDSSVAVASAVTDTTQVDPINFSVYGCVHDFRYGCTVFSGLANAIGHFYGGGPASSINWVSNGTLDHIIGVDVGAPTDTGVTYFPLNSI